MIVALLRLALAVAIGILLTRSLWPKDQVTEDRELTGFLGVGLGLGLLSGLYFAWLIFLPGWKDGFLGLEIILSLALAYLRFRGTGLKIPRTNRRPRNRLYWILASAFTVASILALAGFIGRFLTIPHGHADAWTVWNSAAKFIARSGADWRIGFSGPTPINAHTDYPLLLPLIHAAAWGGAASQNAYIPILVAGLFTASTVGVLIAALKRERGIHQGLIAGLVLVATPFFVIHGTSQYADIPLGFFILSTVVLFSIYDREASPRSEYLALAGLAGACAAWMKNEGLLFFIACLAFRFGMVVSSRGIRAWFREIGVFLLGASPILAALAYFKVGIAPANDLVRSWSVASVAGRLANPERFRQVGGGYLKTLALLKNHVLNIPLVLTVYLLLAGWQVEKKDRRGLVFIVALFISMLVAELIVYLLSPHDIAWHIEFSLSRLWLQLYPTGLYFYFLVVRSPEISGSSLPSRTAVS